MLVLLAGPLALLLAASAAPTPPGALCAGIRDGLESNDAGDLRFSRRALQMVEAALAGDEEGVRAAVAPDAEFILWRGDNSTSARERGSAGAMEFIRDLRPARFQIASDFQGPVSRLVGDCAWEMTILFRTADPAKGVSVEFRFRRGLVVSAVGNQVAILESDIRPRTLVDARPAGEE